VSCGGGQGGDGLVQLHEDGRRGWGRGVVGCCRRPFIVLSEAIAELLLIVVGEKMVTAGCTLVVGCRLL
jgi:hypothetical protein